MKGYKYAAESCPAASAKPTARVRLDGERGAISLRHEWGNHAIGIGQSIRRSERCQPSRLQPVDAGAQGGRNTGGAPRRGGGETLSHPRRLDHGGRPRFLRDEDGRVCLHHRPLGMRQVDAFQHHRRVAWRLRGPRAGRWRGDPRLAPLDRHGVPGGIHLSLAYGAGKCRVPARDRRCRARGNGPSGLCIFSVWSGWTALLRAIRPSSRGACASASRWHAPWPSSRKSC